MDIVNLIISLLSGVAGGNAAGAGLKEKSLGTLGNSLAGLIGGGAGGWILQALDVLNKAGVADAVTGAAGAQGFDLGTLLANVAGSGVGGAVLTAVVAWLKNSMNKG